MKLVPTRVRLEVMVGELDRLRHTLPRVRPELTEQFNDAVSQGKWVGNTLQCAISGTMAQAIADLTRRSTGLVLEEGLYAPQT